jgi:hypothetical protein
MTMSTQDESNNPADPLQEKLKAFADHVETQIALHGHDAFTPDQWAKVREILQSSHDLLNKMEMLQARRMIENSSAKKQDASRGVG